MWPRGSHQAITSPIDPVAVVVPGVSGAGKPGQRGPDKLTAYVAEGGLCYLCTSAYVEVVEGGEVGQRVCPQNSSSVRGGGMLSYSIEWVMVYGSRFTLQ